MNRPGMVYLVGAGPGDEGLITVKGASLLQSCDCIIYDYLASEKLLTYCKTTCERIFAGKKKGNHSMSQEEINQLLVEKARQGNQVVRLKGGDPFVFGRGWEEVTALRKAGISCQIVPGVTSVTGVLAGAGIPITHRGMSQSFHVITGNTEKDGGLPKDFYTLGNCRGTIVCLMGLSHLKEFSKGLIEQGWSPDTPAAVIQDGTMPNQRAVFADLETIEEKTRQAGLKTPAIIVAGETAGLAKPEENRQNQRNTLNGIQVGITGTDTFIERLENCLQRAGAATKVVCRLSLVLMNEKEREESYCRLQNYTWLVFTSANGVRLYFEGLFRQTGENFFDLRELGHVKIAVIGKGTKRALEKFHLKPDYMPDVFTSRELALGLTARLCRGDRVLIPRARQGSKELTKILNEAQIPCDDLPIYDVKGEVEDKSFISCDFLTFASASGVRAFFSSHPSFIGDAKICCIGEVTAAALREEGYRPDCIAREASAEGIAELICTAAKCR